MDISRSGKIGIEGLGEWQVRSGLHRMIARQTTHNPERQERAEKPEQYQSTNHDHVTTHAANGPIETAISHAQKEVEQ